MATEAQPKNTSGFTGDVALVWAFEAVAGAVCSRLYVFAPENIGPRLVLGAIGGSVAGLVIGVVQKRDIVKAIAEGAAFGIGGAAAGWAVLDYLPSQAASAAPALPSPTPAPTPMPTAAPVITPAPTPVPVITTQAPGYVVCQYDIIEHHVYKYTDQYVNLYSCCYAPNGLGVPDWSTSVSALQNSGSVSLPSTQAIAPYNYPLFSNSQLGKQLVDISVCPTYPSNLGRLSDLKIFDLYTHSNGSPSRLSEVINPSLQTIWTHACESVRCYSNNVNDYWDYARNCVGRACDYARDEVPRRIGNIGNRYPPYSPYPHR